MGELKELIERIKVADTMREMEPLVDAFEIRALRLEQENEDLRARIKDLERGG